MNGRFKRDCRIAPDASAKRGLFIDIELTGLLPDYHTVYLTYHKTGNMRGICGPLSFGPDPDSLGPSDVYFTFLSVVVVKLDGLEAIFCTITPYRVLAP